MYIYVCHVQKETHTERSLVPCGQDWRNNIVTAPLECKKDRPSCICLCRRDLVVCVSVTCVPGKLIRTHAHHLLCCLPMIERDHLVAACCSVLQRVAACCSVLQRVAACCNVPYKVIKTMICCASRQWHREITLLQHVAACCSVLQCDAACCSVLQCVAVCCSV